MTYYTKYNFPDHLQQSILIVTLKHNGLVAQLVERVIHTAFVAGSSLANYKRSVSVV